MEGESELTARELEVLTLLAAGERVSEIAAEWMVSQVTVRTHLSRIYAKLGVRSQAGAVAEAMRRGLLT
jgi:DNA-binding CsgD family transcriptional regulator